MSKRVKRLIEQFQPLNYKLHIIPDAKSLTFSGTVEITGKKVGPPSQRITLHQKDLKITEAKIININKDEKKQIAVNRINLQKKLYEARFHTVQLMYPGNYVLSLKFEGKITKAMQGLYPSFFKHKGKDEVILVTQLEAHHAREMFPSIDEPEAKATFDLSITAPSLYKVISNTPVKKQLKKGSLTTHAFETTPKMSSYLLAFVIGKLHSTETTSNHGVVVRTWASVAQPKKKLTYATKEAARVLDFFTDYFDTPYPLKKLDQIALPDFDSGAMENWGMPTYREIVLLSDPDNPSISGEQLITLVVSHELSHMWFGDLVTMKWWDELWLNESFAGLMEHVAPDALHPDWQQWELHAISDIALITSRDSYKNIQSLIVDVNDPDLIETLFDPSIVYAKGARLLKMLRDYIGEEAFVKGLHRYFKAYAYSNATRHELWEALGAVEHKNIESFMTPWLTQSGMPVVHVTQKGKKLSLRQERFLLDAKPDDSLWPIPLLAEPDITPNIFDSKAIGIVLPTENYIVLNKHASGQYITHYTEPAHRNYLAKAFAGQEISSEARINVLNDLYMLSRHGDSSLTEILDIIRDCQNEPRDSVWGIILRTIGAANQLTEGDEKAEKDLKALRKTIANVHYEKLGWQDKPNDDSNTKQLRHTVIACMVHGEDKEAVKKALAIYGKAKSLETIPAEIRSTVLAAAVKHGPSKVIDRLLKEYPDASSEIQSDITYAIAATKSGPVIKKALPAAIGEKGFVRDQDILRWLAVMLRNHHIRDYVWNFMTHNWQRLEESLEHSKSFDYLPTYCAGVISTTAWQKKYQAFFNPKDHNKSLHHNIALGLADIESRIAWRKREEAKIKKWLAKNIH